MRFSRRAADFIGSMNFTLIILVASFFLVLTGTLLQIRLGIYQVQQQLFYAWYGGGLILALFLVNMLFSIIRRFPGVRRPFGLIIGHIGLVVLLFGGFSDVFSEYFVLGIWEGQQADRIFYSDRWEVTYRISGPEDALPIADRDAVLGSFVLGSHRGNTVYTWEIGADDSRRTYRLEIDQVIANARPDAEAPGMYLPVPWADSAASNLPLLSGRLISPGGGTNAVDIWAGSAIGTGLTIPVGGRPATLELALRPAEEPLPFTIGLLDFEAEFFPDTDIPRSFVSQVEIRDAGPAIRRSIAMNRPLRYRNYVFYQSSYQFNNDGTAASVFSVQKTGGALLPYIGTGISFFGFLFHYFSRGERRRGEKKRRAKLSGAKQNPSAATVMPAAGAERRSASAVMPGGGVDHQTAAAVLPDRIKPVMKSALILLMFCACIALFVLIGGATGAMTEDLAVYSGGRLMPAESFGGILLYELSGRRRAAGYDGAAFIEALLFSPLDALRADVIKVNHPDLFTLIGLPDRPTGRYSAADFLPAIENIAALAAGLAPGEDPLSDELLLLDARLETVLRLAGSLEFLRIDNPESIEPDFYRGHPLRVMPGGDGLWYHPLDPSLPPSDRDSILQSSGILSPDYISRIITLQADSTDLSSARLRAEGWYRNLRPYRLAGLLFAASALMYIYLASRNRAPAAYTSGSRWLVRAVQSAAPAGVALGVLLSLSGLLLRIFITGRPPVTSLYSSLLLVGFLMPVAGIVLGVRNSRQQAAVLLCASLVLLVSPGFISGGDDLAVVQAVLDSNFWLSVHVLVIITGYALVFLASAIGHVHAVSIIRSPDGPGNAAARYRGLLLSLRLALLFMFVGTMLGGIWADQSWGRFWGWDPKENAALLLIIWLSLLLHARPGEKLSEYALSLSSAASLIVLLFSWFGVNLMATGLHSYGWDPRAGGILALGVGGELLFLGAAWYFRKKSGSSDVPVLYRIDYIERFGDEFLRVGISRSDGSAVIAKPGQCITFRITHRGRSFLRAYSVETCPRDAIVIQRREGGLAWEFFAEDARVGQKLRGGPAHGDFTLGENSISGELFIAAGAGFAPVLSMLHARSLEAVPQKGGRLLVATGDLAYWPFYSGLETIAKRLPRLKIDLFVGAGSPGATAPGYAAPDAAAPSAGSPSTAAPAGGSPVWLSAFEAGRVGVHQRRIDVSDVQDLSGDLSTAYICGGADFVEIMSAGLSAAGSDLAIHREAFTPAHSRSRRPAHRAEMRLLPDNSFVTINPGESVLDGLTKAGRRLRGNCLVGRCGECRCTLVSGRVIMDEPNILDRRSADSGTILSCCSYPNGDIEIEI